MSAVLRCIDRVMVRSDFSNGFRLSHPSRSNVDSGNGVKQSKDIQEPQDHRNHDNAIQNRLDGSLHGNEPIDQLQQNTHHDENF